MERRTFLVRTGLGLGAVALTSPTALAAGRRTEPVSWNRLRDQFILSPSYIHLAGFFIVSHPAPVREAIETHRRGLDENPFGYFVTNVARLEGAVLAEAANYLGARPVDIALTDSTTTGLGLLYANLRLRPGQELTVEPDKDAVVDAEGGGHVVQATRTRVDTVDDGRFTVHGPRCRNCLRRGGPASTGRSGGAQPVAHGATASAQIRRAAGAEA